MDGKTVYACTFVEKTAEEDDFERGCIGKRSCIIADDVNIESDTLKGLIAACGERYGLDIDDVFLPDDDNGIVNGFGFNRLEDGDSNEPTERQKALWKERKLTLYLADYYFAVEARCVLPLTVAEFKASGIASH